MNIRRAQLYWNTIRHLRWIQVAGRVWFRLYRPRPDTRPAPQTNSGLAGGAWVKGASRSASLTGTDEWTMLGARGSLSQLGWDNPQCSKLWRYNQHYFDDLAASDASTRTQWHRALVSRWIEDNPSGTGTGWEPYPTSLRIVNWVKWTLSGQALSPAMCHSLAIQARWLVKRLEYHILGNHLLANAKALIFAGALFEGQEALHWLRLGKSILERQLKEQILSDGGHFELSPMYHLIVLEDLLDVYNLCQTAGLPPVTGLVDAITGMMSWSAVMRHPDGEIPFFNDAAFGIAPLPSELDAYAARLGLVASPAASAPGALHDMSASGYARLSIGDAVAFVDMAAVGPDYLPGHAHADTLSFELSLDTRRVIVNGGTSQYGTDPERQRQRATPSHSTLSLDGLDSSEVWGGFRTARRARVTHRACHSDDGSVQAAATHDGYARLPGRPLHRREWTLHQDGLTVVDEIIGAGKHVAQINFLLAPALVPERGEDGQILVRTPEGDLLFAVRIQDHAEVSCEAAQWHPRFGQSVATQSIQVRFPTEENSRHTTVIRWITA